MLEDIESAAPVLMRTPESTPAARMRRIAGDMSFMPEIIASTVPVIPQPESRPPRSAPAIRL